MSDQCKHCLCRGNEAQCMITPCSIRESWILDFVRARLTAENERLARELAEIQSQRKWQNNKDWFRTPMPYLSTLQSEVESPEKFSVIENDELDHIQITVDRLTGRVRELEANRDRLALELEEAKMDVNEQGTALADARHALDMERTEGGEIKRLEAELAAADQWCADHAEWVDPEAYAVARERIAALEAECTELAADRGKAINETFELKIRIDEMQEERGKTAKVNTDLALANMDLQDRISALEGALERIATFESQTGPSDEAMIARAALDAGKGETDTPRDGR